MQPVASARRPSLVEHVDLEDQLRILSKAPEERTPDDLERLAISFGSVKFFQQFDAGKVAELCKVFRLETYAPGNVVYREGEAGNKCFVILSGSVTIYAPEGDGGGQGGGGQLDETAAGLRSMCLRERAEALANRELQQQLLEQQRESQQVQQVEEVWQTDKQNGDTCSPEQGEEESGANAVMETEHETQISFDSDPGVESRIKSVLGLAPTRFDTSGFVRAACESAKRAHHDWESLPKIDFELPVLERAPSTSWGRMEQHRSSQLPSILNVQQKTTPAPSDETKRSNQIWQVAKLTAKAKHLLSKPNTCREQEEVEAPDGGPVVGDVAEIGEAHQTRRSNQIWQVAKLTAKAKHLQSKPKTHWEQEEVEASDGGLVVGDVSEVGEAEVKKKLQEVEVPVGDAEASSGAVVSAIDMQDPIIQSVPENEKRSDDANSPNVLDGNCSSITDSGEGSDTDGQRESKDERRDSQDDREDGGQSGQSGATKPVTEGTVGGNRNSKRRFAARRPTKKVAVLQAGSSFGESALQNMKLRVSTVRANQPTHLAALLRHDYWSILSDFIQWRIAERTAFLMRVPLLESLDEFTCQQLAWSLQQRDLIKHELVYGTETPPLQVFIVREGEFGVYCPAPKDDKCASAASCKQVTAKPGADPFGRERHGVLTALVAPMQVMGLRDHLRGERTNGVNVVCRSAVGRVFCMRGKTLANHLSPELRERLLESAHLRQKFLYKRSCVLHDIRWQGNDAASGRKVARGQRRWPQEEVTLERLRRLRSKANGSANVYSLPGRLRIIGDVVRRQLPGEVSTNKPGTADMVEPPPLGCGAVEVDEAAIKSCWFAEELAKTGSLQTTGLATGVAKPDTDADESAAPMPTLVARANAKRVAEKKRSVLAEHVGTLRNSDSYTRLLRDTKLGVLQDRAVEPVLDNKLGTRTIQRRLDRLLRVSLRSAVSAPQLRRFGDQVNAGPASQALKTSDGLSHVCSEPAISGFTEGLDTAALDTSNPPKSTDVDIIWRSFTLDSVFTQSSTSSTVDATQTACPKSWRHGMPVVLPAAVDGLRPAETRTSVDQGAIVMSQLSTTSTMCLSGSARGPRTACKSWGPASSRGSSKRLASQRLPKIGTPSARGPARRSRTQSSSFLTGGGNLRESALQLPPLQPLPAESSSAYAVNGLFSSRLVAEVAPGESGHVPKVPMVAETVNLRQIYCPADLGEASGRSLNSEIRW